MPAPAGLAALALDGLAALARYAPDLAVVALLLLAAFLAGHAPVRRLRPAPDAALVLATALGLALFGTGAALLALAGLFRPAPLAALLALAAAPGAIGAARRVGSAARRRRRSARAALLPALVLVAAATLPAAVVALYPATGFDGTTYHLPLAAMTARTGTLGPFTSIRYWWFPQLNGMLFATALAAGSPRTAQLLGVALFALGGLGAFALARRAAGRGAGLLAASAWLATPLAAENAWGASVDTALALFVVAGALALQVFLDRDRPGWALLAGALLGAAAGVKLFGATYAGAGAAVVAWRAVRTRRPGLLLRFVAGAALAGGLWYVRTGLLVGNPVYPAATGVFGNHGPASDEAIATLSSDMSAWFGKPRTPRELLALPFEAVAWPCRLSESRIGLHPSFPILLLAVPAAFLRRRRGHAATLLLALAGAGAWLATWPVLRYALPFVALTLAAGAAGIANTLRAALGRGPAWRVPATLSIAILLLPPGTAVWAAWTSATRGPVPRDAREERLYVERRLPGAGPLLALGRDLGERQAVFSLGCENLALYSGGALLAGVFAPDRAGDVLPGNATASSVRRELVRLGATHVLLCPGTPFVERWRRLGPLSWAVRVGGGDGAELFEMAPGPPGVTPRLAAPNGSSSAARGAS